MIWHKLKSMIGSESSFSLYGQTSFLLANFFLFWVLINKQGADEFGSWAVYITVITIVDSIRQGLVQNGLIRFIVTEPQNRSGFISTAFIINYVLILVAGILIWLISSVLMSQSQSATLLLLFSQSVKGLLALGSLQFVNLLFMAEKDFRGYFFNNLSYLTAFAAGLLYLGNQPGLVLVDIINLQLLAVVPGCLMFVLFRKPKLSIPRWAQFRSLIDFGKYTAGTNVLSMVFHRADVLMLAVFSDPATVAVYHFATKIVGYADLPLNALSQVIYPSLAASYRNQSDSHLKQVFIQSLIRLLSLSIPISIGVIMFNNTIIYLLSSGSYISSSELIIILCLGALFKPFGRVFGLTLEAIGQPKVNFHMLCFSLIVNIIMNLIFIPLYGGLGAAIATSISIASTVIWGQLRLRKWLPITLSELKSAMQEKILVKTNLI